MDKNHIRETYKVFLLENGKIPSSVFALCKLLNISEGEFYDHYNSLEAIDKDIWLSIFESTLQHLENDEVYRKYSAREKLLAFYFTWVQKLKENRSYVLLFKSNLKLADLKIEELESFRKAFEKYAHHLILQGYETREIKERKFISDKYKHGFWLQALFVLNFWIKDSSQNFESTDAAIEKAVDISFRLIGENSFDSLLDFGKFLFSKK
jgi:hypothetical protein